MECLELFSSVFLLWCTKTIIRQNCPWSSSYVGLTYWVLTMRIYWIKEYTNRTILNSVMFSSRPIYIIIRPCAVILVRRVYICYFRLFSLAFLGPWTTYQVKTVCVKHPTSSVLIYFDNFYTCNICARNWHYKHIVELKVAYYWRFNPYISCRFYHYNYAVVFMHKALIDDHLN